MTPIFIASYGRSGSTLLMRALAAHHKITARALFPYETRMAQHLFLCYREGMRFPPFAPVKFQQSDYHAYIDSDAPSKHWAEYHRKAEIGECGLRLAREYYRFVAELQNQSEPEYFAEKAIGLTLVGEMSRSMKRCKILFLQRDPRDIFISVKEFNRKRGLLSFGEENGDEALLNQILHYTKSANLMARNLDKQAIVVQYEDFVRDKADSIRNLFRNLNVNTSPWRIHQIVDLAFREDHQVKTHRSATSHADSIGRWRINSSPSMLQLFEKYRQDIAPLVLETSA